MDRIYMCVRTITLSMIIVSSITNCTDNSKNHPLIGTRWTVDNNCNQNDNNVTVLFNKNNVVLNTYGDLKKFIIYASYKNDGELIVVEGKDGSESALIFTFLMSDLKFVYKKNADNQMQIIAIYKENKPIPESILRNMTSHIHKRCYDLKPSISSGLG